MGDYLPKFKPGQAITITATAAVVGGHVVTGAGTHAGADSPTWLGVAAHDAADGDIVTVYCDGVQRLVASAAIAANALVKCAAGGEIATYVAGTDGPEELVGLALEAATEDGDVIAVKIR